MLIARFSHFDPTETWAAKTFAAQKHCSFLRQSVISSPVLHAHDLRREGPHGNPHPTARIHIRTGRRGGEWPLAARAQQPSMPVVGFLDYGLPAPKNSPGLTAFRRGLSEAGYVEGQNVTFEFRWAHTKHSLLPELAADLVRRQAAVIVATGSPTAVLAAKAATSTVPIVFATAVDPVKYGFVDSSIGQAAT